MAGNQAFVFVFGPTQEPAELGAGWNGDIHLPPGEYVVFADVDVKMLPGAVVTITLGFSGSVEDTVQISSQDTGTAQTRVPLEVVVVNTHPHELREPAAVLSVTGHDASVVGARVTAIQMDNVTVGVL